MVVIRRFNSKFRVIRSFNSKNVVIRRLWIRIYIVNWSENGHSWHSRHVMHWFNVIFWLNSRQSRHENKMYFFDISFFLFLPLSTLRTCNQYIVCYLVLKLLTLTTCNQYIVWYLVLKLSTLTTWAINAFNQTSL